MSLLPSSNTFKDIIDKAQNVIKEANNKASNSSVGQTIKDKIYASTAIIQEKLNAILAKGGIITQKELDELDEQMRKAKIEMLAADSNSSFKKFGTYIGVGLLVFAALWYISNRKTKTS